MQDITGKILSRHIVALFQHDDGETTLRQRRGGSGTACATADDDDIGLPGLDGRKVIGAPYLLLPALRRFSLRHGRRRRQRQSDGDFITTRLLQTQGQGQDALQRPRRDRQRLQKLTPQGQIRLAKRLPMAQLEADAQALQKPTQATQQPRVLGQIFEQGRRQQGHIGTGNQVSSRTVRLEQSRDELLFL